MRKRTCLKPNWIVISLFSIKAVSCAKPHTAWIFKMVKAILSKRHFVLLLWKESTTGQELLTFNDRILWTLCNKLYYTHLLSLGILLKPNWIPQMQFIVVFDRTEYPAWTPAKSRALSGPMQYYHCCCKTLEIWVCNLNPQTFITDQCNIPCFSQNHCFLILSLLRETSAQLPLTWFMCICIHTHLKSCFLLNPEGRSGAQGLKHNRCQADTSNRLHFSLH